MNEEKRINNTPDANVVYLHTSDDEIDSLIQDLGQLIDEEYDAIIAKYEQLEDPAKYYTISAELDRSVREMCVDVEQERKKQKNRRLLNNLAKVCVICILIATVTFTFFAPQVEALRLKLYNIMVERFDGHIGVEFTENENTPLAVVDNVIDEEDRTILRETFESEEEILYPEKMFEGFELYRAEKIINDYNLYFKNYADKYILVQVYDGNTKMYPDSEQSKIKDIMINNQSALLRESEERFHIYFYTDGRVIVMSVDKASISEEDVIKSAESIKKIKI